MHSNINAKKSKIDFSRTILSFNITDVLNVISVMKPLRIATFEMSSHFFKIKFTIGEAASEQGSISRLSTQNIFRISQSTVR